MPRLVDLVHSISSKNAGNFHLTFDIVFADAATYRHVLASNVLTRETIARLYSVSETDVVRFVEFPQGLAIKASIRRGIPSGGIGETDVYGSQQYAPLLDIEVPDAAIGGRTGAAAER